MTEGFLSGLKRALARNTPAFDPPRATQSSGGLGLRAALARGAVDHEAASSDGGGASRSHRTDHSRPGARREGDSAASAAGLPAPVGHPVFGRPRASQPGTPKPVPPRPKPV
ncbi:hypothetical protein FHR81_000761 [Actinoalloteichus hoggarensis]|uniref:Uncharacterized protein n=1 Tax=Actinoalloteichus hoggarensis TaxID=1470176 RepID=A0A221W1W1_9PSEU|nr:hypothetical protein [Actinoalloteichus hoggarensis]ASO19561.1 hypothetical protein AHOG_09585 [Actinoalloteichus hoggarensis]MBB5919732.1 hypothetical protein [Actinoalloteichus hoggarensis]